MGISASRAVSAISYLSFLFWIIAFMISNGKRNEFITKHLNQSFNLNIISLVVLLFGNISNMPRVNTVLSVILFVLMLWGMINATRGSSENIPFLNLIEIL